MEHRAKNCWVKLPQNMFKTRLHTFGNVFAFFGIFKIFWFFWNFSKTRPSMEHWARMFFFRKQRLKTRSDTWERFGQFKNFETFLIFSLIFSECLPQNLSPENWTQNFQVRKTEFIFLSSGLWTHNFKSRTSEVELRILTVARMQRECLLSIVS